VDDSLQDSMCRRCALWESCASVCIPGDGPIDAELLVVGIAPGGAEDREGRPFVGQSGKLLRSVLEENALVARLTNVARCRPPENRDPTAAEMRACRIYFEDEVRNMPRLKYAVALGSLPMKALGVPGSVTDFAGVPRRGQVADREIIVIPVLHPAAVLRRQTYLSTWESHWHQVRNIVRPPKESFAERLGAQVYEHGLEGRDWRVL
jgi:uracil-DNA glycosylase family 4